MRDRGLPDRVALAAWESLDPDIGVDLGNFSLPPVYFHGKRDHSQEVVYGLVHLTTDSPPEMRWVIAFHSLNPENGCAVAIGVQLGGRGARRGVVAVSCTCSDSDSWLTV